MAKILTEYTAGNILEKDVFLRISNTLIKMIAGENAAIFRDGIEEVHRVYEWILSFLDVHKFK